MSCRRPSGRGEEGAALELALIFLTAIALFVGSLLGFTDTSSRATGATRTERDADYDADSAMQADIATLRASTTLGYLAGSCGSYTPLFALNGSVQPHVDCVALAPPTSSQRQVALTAYASSTVGAPVVLRALVTFFDDGSTGRALSIQLWSNR